MKRENPRAKVSLWWFVGGAALLIALIWGTVAIATNITNNAVSNVNKESPVAKGATGKSVEDDKQSSVAAAAKILNLALKSPTGATIENRLLALDKDDFTVIDPELKKMVRFAEGAPDGLEATTWQTLVTMAMLFEENNKGKEVAPVGEESWKAVYVDRQLGIAFVPMGVFAGQQAAFSFEMMYLDGEWKLVPYGLVDAVRLSSILAPEPTAAATK